MVRVIDGDALVLDTGQSVRLVGVEAPARPYKDREGEFGHEEAKRMLEDIVLGREVELRYAGPTRDRYDRALAHVVTADSLGEALWLNAEMVRRGGARVRVYPDTALSNDVLVGMEAKARAAKAGLWAKRAWTIPRADDLPDVFERFQLVEGVVSTMDGTDERGAVCELGLVGSPLRLKVQTGAAQLCQLEIGTELRARGCVYRGNMEISHPLNLEVLGQK